MTHTKFDDNAWWQVDLEDNFMIEVVKVYNRQDCCAHKLDNFDLIIMDNSKEVWRYTQEGTAQKIITIAVPVNAMGNKVRVQLRGKNYLHLAEVEVFGHKPINIAKNKPTSQSSDYSTTKGLSQNAVDGNTDPTWGGGSMTHTKFDDNAWWQVDLEDNFMIEVVKVYNRQDCCAHKLDNFDLIIMDNSKEVWRYTQEGTAQKIITIAVPVKAIGNKVRVQLRGKNYLHLAEVEVFGYN